MRSCLAVAVSIDSHVKNRVPRIRDDCRSPAVVLLQYHILHVRDPFQISSVVNRRSGKIQRRRMLRIKPSKVEQVIAG
jgi:hypothetical protein